MKKSSQILAFRFGKNGVGIALANGETLPVSEQLLTIIAKSTGFALSQQLVLNGAGATVSYEQVEVKAGQAVTNNGKVVMDATGQPRVYTKDHTRYNNISVQLSQTGLNAANIGMALAQMFTLPSAPVAATPVIEQIPEGITANSDIQPAVVNEPVFAGAEEATN